MEAVRREAVRLEDVWVAYSGSGRPAIRDISLVFLRGEFTLITGPNGAGKTTLIETCLGLLKPLKGRVLLLGIDTRSRKIIKARRKCSYVPQDFMKPPYESYTARHVIELGLALEKLSGSREVEKRIEWVSRLLGIEDLLDKPIGILSGGQQQKIYLARALARKPEVLFLDEPFSSLDKESREHLASVLRKYVDEKKASAIIVSHDTGPVAELVDCTVIMEEGRVVRVERR